MSISASDARATAAAVALTDDSIVVELRDGRTITAPIGWYPRLSHATADERGNFQLIGQGEGIHWPDVDEDVSVDNLLRGQPSGESQASFKAWLDGRRDRP